MDEIVQCEDDIVDEQKVSNSWLWHWLEIDVNIDIKLVCQKLKWTGKPMVIYVKECFRKV